MARIKKVLKKTFFIFFCFILLTQILDLIGWLSDEEPINKSEIMEITPLPTEENGYEFVKHLDYDNNRVLNKDYQDTDLTDLLEKKEWDIKTKKTVESLLNSHSKRNTLVQQVVAKPHFQSKITESFYDSFSHYGGYTDLLRLKLLESRDAAEKQNFSKATALAEEALIFSQRIKADKMPTLISFVVGISHQNQAISWIHQLGSRYAVSDADRKKLINTLNKVSDYQNDNFNESINGEIRFYEFYIQAFDYWNFSERISLLTSSWNNEDIRNPRVIIHSALSFFSPHYFLQKGKLSNFSYQIRNEDTKQVRKSCIDIEYSHYDQLVRTKNSFFSLFKSNSMGKLLFENTPSFEIYFLRRCQAGFHLQAVKTALTILQAESKQGNQIKRLDELIPQPLTNVPIDASNGKPLMFDAENRWIYSVGTNYTDNQGSLDSIFHNRCIRSKKCKQNPTVPIIYQAPVIEK